MPESEHSELLKRMKDRKRSIEFVASFLKGKDVSPADSVVLNDAVDAEGRTLICDPDMVSKVQNAGPKKPVFALAGNDGLIARRRNAVSRGVLDGIFQALPTECDGDSKWDLKHSGRLGVSIYNQAYHFETREACAEQMREKVFVFGGSQFTLGRLQKYYPDLGMPALKPVSQAEAEAALKRCGLLAVEPALPRTDWEDLMVNPTSDNGLPVLGKWNTSAEAQQMVKRLATTVYGALARDMYEYGSGVVQVRSAIVETVRRLELEQPYMFTLLGKAKADIYTRDKLNQCQMRFYNVVGRQNMFVMMKATQPFEERARNFVSDPSVRTSIGASLGPDSAEEWVAALDVMLEHRKVAYVHCGDDSWVALHVKVAGAWQVVMFALDCSSFDLTQHADVTAGVHEALHRELSKVDQVSAGLWYALMRQRNVIVSGNLAYTFRHAGPSGMPLQSKVNDMLMDVLINRVLTRFEESPADSPWSVESVDALEEMCERVVAQEGARMGFRVRLEQFSVTQCDTIKEALVETPFLYVGYYFYVQGSDKYKAESRAWADPTTFDGNVIEVRRKVKVVCDMPRALAQLAYPTNKWVESEALLKGVTEPVRLSSVYLSAGEPTPGLQGAFYAWATSCMKLLDKALAVAGEDSAIDLGSVYQQGVFGPELPKSLMGLRKAVMAKRDGAEPVLAPQMVLQKVGPFRGVTPMRLVSRAHVGKVQLGRRPSKQRFTAAEKAVRALERLRQAEAQAERRQGFRRDRRREYEASDDAESSRRSEESDDYYEEELEDYQEYEDDEDIVYAPRR